MTVGSLVARGAQAVAATIASSATSVGDRGLLAVIVAKRAPMSLGAAANHQ